MGGSAFPNYHLPRMTHAQYNALRDKCLSILGNLYRDVISPPEAPSKADHGDLDLIVSDPLKQFKVGDLMEAIGAVARTKGNGPITSFCVALPLCRDRDENETTMWSTVYYAQVDIHVVEPEFLDWVVFMHSYGDMMQIIGRLQRSLGLTANERGLHVRVAEIEAQDRKSAMIFLSHDPEVMMNFLLLDAAAFARGFKSNEELFEWIAHGRFFGVQLLRGHDDNSYVNKDERKRYQKRTMFVTFMTEWAPKHADMFVKLCQWGRDEVLTEAWRWFGDAPRVEYARKVAEYNGRIAFLALVKQVVPAQDHATPNLVVKGLQRWVVFKTACPMLQDDEATLQAEDLSYWSDFDAFGVKERDAFIEFVSDHWKELLRREQKRANSLRQGNIVGLPKRWQRFERVRS